MGLKAMAVGHGTSGDGRKSEARQAAMTAVGPGDCHVIMQVVVLAKRWPYVRGVEMTVTKLEIREDQGLAGWYEKGWPKYRQ